MTKANNLLKKNRVWEIDLLRGILVILSIVDHIFVVTGYFNFFSLLGDKLQTSAVYKFYLDFKGIFMGGTSIKKFWPEAPGFVEVYFSRRVGLLQPLILSSFFFISGISSAFSKNHFKRFFRFAVAAAILFELFWIGKILFPQYVKGEHCYNFILTFALCYGVWWLLHLIKVPHKVITAFSVLFALWGLVYMLLWIRGTKAPLDDDKLWMCWLFYNDKANALSPINFVPILPNLPLFCLGGTIGTAIYKDKKSLCGKQPFILKPITFVGQKSLTFFFGMPALILGVLYLLIACGM